MCESPEDTTLSPNTVQQIIECDPITNKKLQLVLESIDPSSWGPSMNVSMMPVVFGERCPSSHTHEKIHKKTTTLSHFDREFVYARRGSSGVVSKCLYEDRIDTSKIDAEKCLEDAPTDMIGPQNIESWRKNAEKELHQQLLGQLNAVMVSKSHMHLELLDLPQKQFHHPLQSNLENESITPDKMRRVSSNGNKRTSLVGKAIEAVVNMRASFVGDGSVQTREEGTDSDNKINENDQGEDSDDEDAIFSEGWQEADACLVSESHELIKNAERYFDSVGMKSPFFSVNKVIPKFGEMHEQLRRQSQERNFHRPRENSGLLSLIQNQSGRFKANHQENSRSTGMIKEAKASGSGKKDMNSRKRRSFVCKLERVFNDGTNALRSTENTLGRYGSQNTMSRNRHSFTCQVDGGLHAGFEDSPKIEYTPSGYDADDTAHVPPSNSPRVARRRGSSPSTISLDNTCEVPDTTNINRGQMTQMQRQLHQIGTVAKLLKKVSSQELQQDRYNLQNFMYTMPTGRSRLLILSTKRKVGQYLKPEALLRSKSFSGDLDALDMSQYHPLKIMMKERFQTGKTRQETSTFIKRNLFLSKVLDYPDHTMEPVLQR